MAQTHDYMNPDVPQDYYHGDCPTLYALNKFNQKWKLPVLWQVYLHDQIHYNQLKRQVVGITNTMLAKSLKELESDGLLSRHQFETNPPTVSYQLTKTGKQLLRTLQPLYSWGDKQLQRS